MTSVGKGAFFVFYLMLIPFSAAAEEGTSAVHKASSSLTDYLAMAGSSTAADFRPLTQQERNKLFLKSLVNPWGFAKTAMSSGLDQLDNKPEEWGQGAKGYGKRFANIQGQYATQRTVAFLVSSALHEDNRYFGSGQHGVWSRTNYALASSVLARHDNGKRYVSVSQVGGVAAGAFIARSWLPPSQSSARDGAISFGITMGSNAAFSIVKEFLPDLLRLVQRKRGASPTSARPIN